MELVVVCDSAAVTSEVVDGLVDVVVVVAVDVVDRARSTNATIQTQIHLASQRIIMFEKNANRHPKVSGVRLSGIRL